MKFNIANNTKDELEKLCGLLGVRINNTSNVFMTQLTVERNGMFYHVGSINLPVMSLDLDEIRRR